MGETLLARQVGDSWVGEVESMVGETEKARTVRMAGLQFCLAHFVGALLLAALTEAGVEPAPRSSCHRPPTRHQSTEEKRTGWLV